MFWQPLFQFQATAGKTWNNAFLGPQEYGTESRAGALSAVGALLRTSSFPFSRAAYCYGVGDPIV